MPRDQFAVVRAKDHSRDAVAWQAAADFPETIAQRATERHANRPAPLHAHEISANLVPVFLRKILQPLAGRFVAGFSVIIFRSRRPRHQATCRAAGTRPIRRLSDLDRLPLRDPRGVPVRLRQERSGQYRRRRVEDARFQHDELKNLRRAAAEMLGWSDKDVAALVAAGKWTEVKCDD